MIIELPFDTSKSPVLRRYRMAFFHFSNNNLAIRKSCARDLGGYDPAAKKSEDVDLCFRLAQSDRWVALREQGVTVRHKARRSFGAMVRQLWGWGFHVGWPYRKTGLRGVHLYWFSNRRRKIAADLELFPGLPFLVCAYFTDLHAAFAAGVASAASAATGHSAAAAALAGLFAFFFWRYTRDDRETGLPPWQALKLGATHLLINAVFSAAVLLGGLKHGVILLPATIIPTKGPELG